jgi:hypothetical protein
MRTAFPIPSTHLVDGDLLPWQGLPGRRQAGGPHQRLELRPQRVHRLEHVLQQDGPAVRFKDFGITAAPFELCAGQLCKQCPPGHDQD